MKKLLLLIFLHLISFCLVAQTALDIKSNFLKQSIIFPQEKVYIHTDKSAYVSGETIWFRIYLVDASLHVSDLAISRYVYVDLIDPMGNVVSHSMIRPNEEDCYHNNIILDGDLPEGHYMIRGYTKYMLNRPDYIFQKKVFISDSQSHNADISVSFTKTGNHRGNAKIAFKDRNGNSIEGVKFTAGVDTTYNLQVHNKDKEVTFRILPDIQQTLYVAFEYQNRVHRKYVSIPDLNEDYDISFYPEGGDILANTENVIGFKAVSTKGVSEFVQVSVMDEAGNMVTSANSNALGMGKLSYFAQANKKYVAVCINAQNIVKEIKLPDARSDVFSLQALWKEDTLSIIARQGRMAPQTPLWLVVHVRGIVVREGAIKPNREVVFDKALFPSGVVHILLLDFNMNPLSERLIFCLNKERAVAEISTERDNYEKREHIQVSVNVRDQDGFPLSGSYSVSVTDNSDILPEKEFTVESVLLLSSDLKGFIESPGYYFENDVDKYEDVDALLLTQGWRRYYVSDVVKGTLELPSIPVEQSSTISGVLRKNFSGKPLLGDSVLLFAPKVGIWDQTLSGAGGGFFFSDLEFPDSTRIILQAGSAKRRETLLEVDDIPVLHSFAFAHPTKILDTFIEKHKIEYLEKANSKYSIEEGVRITELSPAVVTANRISVEKGVPAQYISVYSNGTGKMITPKMIEDEIFQTNNILSLLLDNVPGLDYATGEFGLPILFFRGASRSFIPSSRTTAAIYIDDFLMDEEFDIRTLPLTAIASIEALRHPSTALTGMNGATGAIFIMTNKWGDAHIQYPKNPGIKAIMPVGYKREVEFYSPKYDSPESLHAAIPDLRTTIYWKPDNHLTDGKSCFDFYAADDNTTYTVIIEGISDQGKLFRQDMQINRTK